ncbi:MAG: hypothetical protein ACJAS9_003990, partial [Polaribacter sp.]
ERKTTRIYSDLRGQVLNIIVYKIQLMGFKT